MNQQLKKKSDKAARRNKPHPPRKRRNNSLAEAVKKFTLKSLAIITTTVLTILSLLFLVSTLSVWLFEWESETHKPQDVSVEVLNGCGQNGAAKELTSILRKNGYQVADFRNADRFDYKHTLVKVRKGSLGAGEAVAASIGCEEVMNEPSEEARADISIVLGEDWEELRLVSGKRDTGEHVRAILDFFRTFTYLEWL